MNTDCTPARAKFLPPSIPLLLSEWSHPRSLRLSLLCGNILVILAVIVCGASLAGTGPTFDIGSPLLSDLWVDPIQGNDAASGASRDQALRTITAAWARIAAVPGTLGTRIQLVAGDYPESHFPIYWADKQGSLDAPILIQSADGPGMARLHGFLNLYHVSYVYLIDLLIDNAGDVLHCERCDHLLIRRSTLTGGDRQAHETIKINQSQYIYIEDSNIGQAYENAIDLVAVHYGHIVRNQIHHGDDWCIYLKGGSAYFSIEGNDIHHCGTGGFSAGQGTGFEYMVSPWLHYEAYALRIVNNLIHETEGAGLGVNGGYDILMAFNTLYRVGQRSHVLEFVFGSRSCDGDPDLPSYCAEHLALGGWGTTRTTGDGEPIPNRNILFYNNVVYNPAGFQSPWQHFAIYGPQSPAPDSHIPSPARTDDHLSIRGNLIWNGPADHPLGLDEESGCQPSNPTCNATQLLADNRINLAMPQFVNAAGGDFRPAPDSALFDPPPIAIPPFSGWDAFIPPVPTLSPITTIDTDYEGMSRTSASAIGAIGSSEGRRYPLIITRAGSGSGVVLGDPAGIDCGSVCSANFLSGTRVVLTVTPNIYSIFTGWSNTCGAMNPCSVTMDAAKAMTACIMDVSDPIPDSDCDGLLDDVDADDDNDGVPDEQDAFPLDPTESVDTDGDDIGNNADLDDDNDGLFDGGDNCPLVANPGQADADGDGLGDACDSLHSGCKAGPVVLSGILFSAGPHSLKSEHGITTQGQVQLLSNAVLTLSAPDHRFSQGFRVAAGARLRVVAGAVSCATATSVPLKGVLFTSAERQASSLRP